MLSLLNNSNRTERILITLKALNFEGIDINKVDEEPEFILVKNEIKINDATEVIKYLCSESPLYGLLDDEKKVIANQWIDFCKNDLEVPVAIMTMLATEKMTHEECPVLAEKKARADLMLNLRKLEVRLKESVYLVGDEISIADIIVAACLRPLFIHVFGEVERKNSPSMCEWINKLYTSAIFTEVVGETTLLVSSKKGKKKNI